MMDGMILMILILMMMGVGRRRFRITTLDVGDCNI
jgi:hypothetical protein